MLKRFSLLILGLIGSIGVSVADPLDGIGLFGSIAHVYHGLPVDRNLKSVTVTPEAAEKSIDDLVARYGSNIDPSKRESILSLRKWSQQNNPDPKLALALKGAEAELAIAASKELQESEAQWKLDYFREVIKERLFSNAQPIDNKSPPKISARDLRWKSSLKIDQATWNIILRWLQNYEYDPITGRFVPSLQYTKDCKAANVPIPPDWGDPAWKLQGEIPTTRLFLNAGNPVEVWTYSIDSKPGGCIALPRWESNKSSVTLGVICQSATSNKACFWDNRPHSGGPKFAPAELSSRSIRRDWVNGYDSALVEGGKCTNCHRGSNVFALHSDTVLSPSLPFNTQTTAPYTPINSLGWTNPPLTTLPGAGGCTSCHSIGNTTIEQSSYCTMLRKAAQCEMPSTASPANWAAPIAAYAAHITALKAPLRCGAAGPPGC